MTIESCTGAQQKLEGAAAIASFQALPWKGKLCEREKGMKAKACLDTLLLHQ